MATLYGQKDNFRTQKVLAAAAYGGTKVTVKDGSPPGDKFPLGLTPALVNGAHAVSGDAGCLWEVAGSALKGQKAEDASAVVGWLQVAESELSPAVLGWVLPSCSLLKAEQKAVGAAKAATMELLGGLNKALGPKTFLVGERLSLADLSLAFDLLPAFQHVLDEGMRKGQPNVTRWFRTVMGQSQVAAVVGDVALCKTPAQFDAAKFAELAPKPEAKGKKEKPAKAEKKKEEKAAPAAEEEDEPVPVKKADPFEQFPKPSFNMEEFKRVYSNEDTEKTALPYLMDKIDWENHSVWYSEYKYPEDLGLTFMSSNLIGGMFQRLDKLRKNCFASVALFGENNASTISGIWIWRGDKLAFELSPDWQIDYASYDWKKLDPKAAETKTLIKEYLCWEGNFGGKKFNQGKIFK